MKQLRPEKGNPLQNFITTHNFLIYLFYYHFSSFSHHFKVYRVVLWFYFDYLNKMLGHLVMCQKLKQIRLETGQCHAKSENHSQLLNGFYYYLSLPHFLIISSSLELIFEYIEIIWLIGEVICRKCRPLRQLWPEPWESLDLFLITHNYFIFMICYRFLFHFLVITRSTELIFDYIEIIWVRSEVF